MNTTQPAPAWMPISTLPTKWPVLLMDSLGKTTTADYEAQFDMYTSMYCRWCYIDLPPLPPEPTAEERQREKDDAACDAFIRKELGEIAYHPDLYKTEFLCWHAALAHARAEGAEVVAGLKADYHKLVCLTKEESAEQAERVKELEGGLTERMNQLRTANDRVFYLEKSIDEWREDVMEIEQQLAAAKEEIRKTYNEWCGRDFMHLPLSEAVGKANEARLAAALAALDEKWKGALSEHINAWGRDVIVAAYPQIQRLAKEGLPA